MLLKYHATLRSPNICGYFILCGPLPTPPFSPGITRHHGKSKHHEYRDHLSYSQNLAQTSNLYEINAPLFLLSPLRYYHSWHTAQAMCLPPLGVKGLNLVTEDIYSSLWDNYLAQGLTGLSNWFFLIILNYFFYSGLSRRFVTYEINLEEIYP